MAKEKARVTLQDIAQATGFTVNTVSRALKNKDDISRETCLKIQQVAREMGYVRNYIASSLRSGRTKTIAMIAGSMTNPFYAILADQIQLGSDLEHLEGLASFPVAESGDVEVRQMDLLDGFAFFASHKASVFEG